MRTESGEFCDPLSACDLRRPRGSHTTSDVTAGDIPADSVFQIIPRPKESRKPCEPSHAGTELDDNTCDESRRPTTWLCAQLTVWPSVRGRSAADPRGGHGLAGVFGFGD